MIWSGTFMVFLARG
ncbi:hypothetical protein [Comamonas sp.]